MDAVERASALRAYAEETASCERCALAAGRTQVVFGSGNPDADLMFVGEAPGFHEDQQGVPFVGQAGKLLERLLAGIGLERADVYIANVLMCRPPGNRDPQPEEISACEPHLWRKLELIQPQIVATLGNFSTKLLSGKPTGITRVHGQPQEVTLGTSRVLLYPLYHPAAALYTPSMLKVLEQDFARIPELIARTDTSMATTALDKGERREEIQEGVRGGAHGSPTLQGCAAVGGSPQQGSASADFCFSEGDGSAAVGGSPRQGSAPGDSFVADEKDSRPVEREAVQLGLF